MSTQKIKTKCEACNSTGLYVGFAEPVGTAVICRTCNGNGFCEIEIKLFLERKRRQGISRVFVDGGIWFARSDNLEKQTITTDEFYAKTRV